MKEKITFWTRLSKGKMLRLLLGLYMVLLLFSIVMACFFSYKQRFNELQTQVESTFTLLSKEYQDLTDNFWQLYMPLFENESYTQNVMQTYMADDSANPLTPIQQNQLEQLLKRMMLLNQDVEWIVIYSKNRSDNYILYSDSPGLKLLTDDFPLTEQLKDDSSQMKVYGLKQFQDYAPIRNTLAICGGIPYYVNNGKILVGYSTAAFDSICQNAALHLDSMSFVLTSNNSVVYEHHETNQLAVSDTFHPAVNGRITLEDGSVVHTYSQTCGSKSSYLTYYASWWEIFFLCHSNTPLLIVLFVIFAFVSFIGYIYILRMMDKEVAIIQNGLDRISENHLDHRIDHNFQQEGLTEIANSINDMAQRLNHSINQAYYYELRQREAELSELQSKFNPHFLYNTLEMLRSRCQKNGDSTSAGLITDMAAIFRGFIGSRNFIPLSEELAFSKRYLSLFGARYGNSVRIQYDFEQQILKYGIIKNVFQPLIENYFVHGFDTSNKENYILLSGRSLDDQRILITIEDNGIGMTPESMEELNNNLHKPIQLSTESYGLKNLHQRLHLFYGDGCGLTVLPNPSSTGLCVQIIAKKMTCEEYEAIKVKKRPSQQ